MRSITSVALIVTLSSCAINQRSAIDVAEEEYGFPDLTVQAFIPPIILAESGATIYLSDLVANTGESRSAKSTVRYYISAVPEIDVSVALVIGERNLRSLGPKERDESMEMPFVIPAGLSPPPLYLAACVDVDDVLTETNESNNCSNSNSRENSLFMSPALFDGVGVTPVLKPAAHDTNFPTF
ncbi:MAG: hypothetical protein KJN72_13260 [Woeseia sp.]|nr:hypothetical protein [Woeseia sp.]